MRRESLKKFQSLMKTRPHPPTPPVPSLKHREPQRMPKSILVNRRRSKDTPNQNQSQSPPAQQGRGQSQHGSQQRPATSTSPKTSSGVTAAKREGVRYDLRSSGVEPQVQSRKSAAVSVLDISPQNNIEIVDDISSAFQKATNKRLPPTPQPTPSPKPIAARNEVQGSYFATRPNAQHYPTPAPMPGPVQAVMPSLAAPTYEESKQAALRPQDRPISDEKAKENAEIMSRLEEERRAIRMQNREIFNSQIWGPALSSDLAEAMRLANERSGTTDASEGIDDERKRYTLPPIEPLFIQKKTPEEEAKRNGARGSETDWAHGVRLAMAKLENRIQTEARSDPRAFMRARRESAQLRAWVASQKRASEARLSALASGRAQPQSPFEQEFVTQLLKESEEVKLKHSSTPLAEAERLFRGSGMTGTTGTGTFPRYTPYLLAPLVEMDDEAGSPSGKQPLQTREREQQPEHRDTAERPAPDPTQSSSSRMSTFEEKKAARRAGLRNYKSLSSFSTSEMSGSPGILCCNLGRFWKPDKFRRQ